MAVLGTQKQEEKILEMGEIAHGMSPDISVMNFKGAFRLGVKEALETSGYTDWKDLAQRTKAEKKRFFEQILKGAAPHLSGTGLSEDQVERIFSRLRQKNAEYINRP